MTRPVGRPGAPPGCPGGGNGSPGRAGCPGRPEREPSFAELLRANLRVIAAAGTFGLAAYGAWRGLRALFPDVAWLQ